MTEQRTEVAAQILSGMCRRGVCPVTAYNWANQDMEPLTCPFKRKDCETIFADMWKDWLEEIDCWQENEERRKTPNAY